MGFFGFWINDFATLESKASHSRRCERPIGRPGMSWIPDVSVYRWERIERDPRAQEHGAFSPPDIAIEIALTRSEPSEADRTLPGICGKRCRIALMLDPRTRTIVDIRPGSPSEGFEGTTCSTSVMSFPGLTLAAGEVFVAMRFE